MIDPDRGPRIVEGFLYVHGESGLTTSQVRELLTALEDSYASVARADQLLRRELAALRVSERWMRRWGPPEFVIPYGMARGLSSVETMSGPSWPLVVSRVLLTSPGFWEFAGALNPLEVLRQYLNDRHERRKDDEYRSRAEAERLAIENAVGRLDVLRSYLELQQEFPEAMTAVEGLQEHITGAVRPALEHLGQADDRQLIDGESARSSRERIDLE